MTAGSEPYRSHGADLIAAERQRQIEAEGWTPEHDAEHDRDDLACAAACYATPPHLRPFSGEPPGGPARWPWERRFWKPTPDDRVRELVKAGALIAAEIDRLRAVANDREGTTCEHDWMERGTPGGRWQECFLCGEQRDVPAPASDRTGGEHDGD